MNETSGEKSTLEAVEASLENWMYGGMLAVLVGVIAEAVPDFLSPNALFVLVARRIGESLIAVGLLGEFVVDIKSRKCQARLKDIANTAFGEVLTRATNAERETAQANERVLRAEKKLRRRAISRIFFPDEVKVFVEAMRRHAGQQFTVAASPMNDDLLTMDCEQSAFVMQLRAMLIDAGWKHESLASEYFIPRVSKGLMVFCGPAELMYGMRPNESGAESTLASSVKALFEVFREFDIGSQGVGNVNLPVPILIVIGLL